MISVISIHASYKSGTDTVYRFIFLVGLSIFTSVVSAATLEQEMSEREFERAGLDKLTDRQLDYLNDYLGREALKPAQSFGQEQLEEIEPVRQIDNITAHIKGEFTGWDGHTLFYLDNGQVWQQRLAAIYRHRATDPEVTIRKGRFGYYLKISASNRQVAVKRIR